MARIRSSQRRKSATAAAVARDLDFPHFWRQLRAAGWTYKKPTGLATEGRYATPDGNGVFVGETAVVAYALEYGLMDEVGDVAGQAAGAEAARTTAPTAATSTAADVGTAAETGSAVATASVASTETVVNTGTVGDTGMADTDTAGPATDVGAARAVMNTGAVRAVVDTGAARPVVVDTRASSPVVGASQIDTTVGLSQGTLDHLFGSPNDSEDELSQAAVPHALGLSPHQFEADTSQREAAMNLHLLSEASGLESGADDDQERQRPATPPRTLRPRVVKKDVNFIPEDEDEKEYESMESGNESDGEGSRDYDFEEEPARDVVSDEDVLSEADAERMDEAFIRSLMIGNTSVTSQEKKQREDALRATQWTPVVSSDFEVDTPEYPGLGEHMALPVAELRAVASSPLQTFLYFMPKSLWVMIADETNRYSLQQLDQRAKGIQTKQHRRRRESLTQIRRRLKLKHEYKPHEILNVIGLLVARMLCPQKRRFSDHWSMVEDGAIPAGNFGRFMGRNRCQDILRDLHFVDNEAPRTRDKLWKLRPIIDKLQQRFLEGWSLPAVISFDEGVLPSTSRRNTTRMFMPDKPHRYGSKMFMTCDSRTSYCHRFELYAGKRQAGTAGDAAFDHKTGAAAVVRNLKVLFAAKARYQWHTVVVDRYYSSVLLAIELLSMGVYVIGTIMTNRLGYDQRIVDKRQSRPSGIPRGTFTFSRSVAVPAMVAFHWWDRKPVHYLCTGSAMRESSVGRNIKCVGQISVPCPSAVSDYQRWMGGVDVHDQLRLQRFSLQTSTKFKKYYRSLFLGFVDMALVNSFLTHKETARIEGTPCLKRGEWLGQLQNQLLQLKAHDFVGVVATPTVDTQRRTRTRTRHTHAPEQSDDWVTVSGVQKRRQRSCKVCALLRSSTSKKSFQTTWFCERCSVDDAKCWLCNKIRHEYRGVMKTCYEIWHEDFDAGEAIPTHLGKRVVLRRPAQKAGARKKTRRELQLRARDESKSGNGEESEDE